MSSWIAISLVLLALVPGEDRALEDRELARRIKRGDVEAFRSFFDRYHGLLFGYLRRMGIAPSVCEEVVQQAFVTIWEQRGRIDDGKSLRAYLFKIGHNRALNQVRDAARFAGEGTSPEMAAASNLEGEAEYALMLSALHRVVQHLPERRRAVFELCFLNGLTYREAAEALDISIKTVENQMAAALKVLREAFEDWRAR